MILALRPFAPEDGPALARLAEESPDAGAVTFGQRFHVDPYVAFTFSGHEALGAVADKPDGTGLAGGGFVHIGHCQLEGERRPYAYLNSLRVHPDFRRQGLAARLAQARIQAARERLGKECVVFAVIQQGNRGSLANARKWCTQMTGQFAGSPVPVRGKPPTPVAGFTARALAVSELDEFANKLNQFYAAYNFFTPESAEALAHWLSQTPFADPHRHLWGVTDAAGNLLAGLALSEQFRLTSMFVRRVPVALRMLNQFGRVLPADGVLKNAVVNRVWFAPGQLTAARFLWQSVRWYWRHSATHLLVNYDVRSPLAEAFQFNAFTPQAKFTMAIQSSLAITETRLLHYAA